MLLVLFYSLPSILCLLPSPLSLEPLPSFPFIWLDRMYPISPLCIAPQPHPPQQWLLFPSLLSAVGCRSCIHIWRLDLWAVMRDHLQPLSFFWARSIWSFLLSSIHLQSPWFHFSSHHWIVFYGVYIPYSLSIPQLVYMYHISLSILQLVYVYHILIHSALVYMNHILIIYSTVRVCVPYFISIPQLVYVYHILSIHSAVSVCVPYSISIPQLVYMYHILIIHSAVSIYVLYSHCPFHNWKASRLFAFPSCCS